MFWKFVGMVIYIPLETHNNKKVQSPNLSLIISSSSSLVALQVANG